MSPLISQDDPKCVKVRVRIGRWRVFDSLWYGEGLVTGDGEEDMTIGVGLSRHGDELVESVMFWRRRGRRNI